MKKLLGMATMLMLACTAAGAAQTVQPKTIKISAKRYEFSPNEITLKKGVPVILQLTSEDRRHGISIPMLNMRTDIEPGKVSELKLTPDKSGIYAFYCDVFCGAGHDDMGGKIKVVD